MKLRPDATGDSSMLQNLVQLEIERERLNGLTRAQGMQLFGMEARNSIAQMLASGKDPDVISAQYVIRGSPSEAAEILQHAIRFEEGKTGEMPNKNIVSILQHLLERVDEGDVSRAHKDETLIQKLKERIESGQSLRSFDLDLTEPELQQLLLAVEPKFRTIVTLMIENNTRLTALLDQHAKFPAMLNPVAFVRKFDEMKQTDGVYVYADLNGFKECNSRYTVDFVDKTLLAVFTRELRKNLPENALAGIKGGDEFIIYLPHQNDTKEALRQVATIMKQACESLTPEGILKYRHLLKKDAMTQQEAQDICDHFATIHAKMSALHKEPGQTFEETEPTVSDEYKKVDTAENKAKFRFPAIDAADASRDNAVFSAINQAAAPVLLKIGDTRNMVPTQNVLLRIPTIGDAA